MKLTNKLKKQILKANTKHWLEYLNQRGGDSHIVTPVPSKDGLLIDNMGVRREMRSITLLHFHNPLLRTLNISTEEMAELLAIYESMKLTDVELVQLYNKIEGL